jgi:transcriptional regulator with XRE-family HTH domain
MSAPENEGPSNYLRTLRERAGLSQLELADLLNVHNTRLSRLERRPPAELAGERSLIIHFAEACKASPTDIELQLFLLRAGLAPWVPEDRETLQRVAAFAATRVSLVPPVRPTARPNGQRSWWFEPGLLTEEQARWLGGWGRAEMGTVYPSLRGAGSKRLLRWRGRARLPPFVGLSREATYQLIVELESGSCDDYIAVIVNGQQVLRTDPEQKIIVDYQVDLDGALIDADGALTIELVNLTDRCHSMTAPILVVELLRRAARLS